MKRILFLLLFSIALININAAENEKNTSENKASTEISSEKLIIHGLIKDEVTNETLAGVEVIYNGETYYTDLDGHFEIKNVINNDKVKISVNLISYSRKVIEVDPRSETTINVKLKQI